MCAGIRAAAKQVETLDGIAVDTWGVDFGFLGPDGSLLANPHHYRDERTLGLITEISEKIPRHEVFRQSGIQFMEINSLYQLYAAKRDSPHILNKASHLLFMPDLFNYFLTGAIAAERTIASTSQFYDPVKKRFATGMLRKLGIRPGFLPRLIDPGKELAPLLPRLAERAGLKHETMVYTTGSHDTASAVAAVPARGSFHDNPWCYISSGTWSLMGVELDEPVINEESLAANFTNEAGVGNKIRLLKNIPGLWVLQECRRAWELEGDTYSYAELMERAEAAESSDTIIDLDEFISPGNHPARIVQHCRETGQEIPEGVGSITRVILNSLAFRYKHVLETLESLTGKKINVIHIVGGGSRNTLLNQLAANVTGRRVIAGPAEATAAGNALTQALGAGEIHSLDELRAIVRQSFEVEEFRPHR